MDDVPIQVQAEVRFGCLLNLDVLCAKAFTNCELARNTKAHLVVNLKRTRAVMKIKSDGEVAITGQCSAEEARNALKRAARKCYIHGWPVKFKHFKISLVRWTIPYRPNFTIDILELGKHDLAEIRQSSGNQLLRVLLPCGSLGNAPKGGAKNGKKNAAAGGTGEEHKNPFEDSAAADAGVWAEVSADGRTRFHGALSIEELQHALDVTVPVLEKYKIQDAPESANLHGTGNRAGSGNGGGKGRGRARAVPLSRESMDLEEPMPFGLLQPSEIAAAFVGRA